MQGRVLTIPNVLSAIRLLLVPVFLYLLLARHAYGWATAILMFSGTSDWADGWPKSKRGRIYAISDPKHENDALVKETKALIGGDWTKRSADELAKLLAHADWRVRLEAHRRLPSSFPQPQPEPPAKASKYLAFASTSGVADPNFGSTRACVSSMVSR